MSIERLSHRLSEYVLESFDVGPDPYAMSGVLFADNFDAGGEVTNAVLPVAPLPDAVVSDDDLLAARQEGYADGVRTGRQDADSCARLAQGLAADALTTALANATDAACSAAEEAASVLGQTMLAAMALLLPEMCARNGPAEAAALVAVLEAMLAPSMQLAIRASSVTLANLPSLEEPHGGLANRRISHIPDDTMSPGNVTVAWQDGSAARNVDSLLSQLRQVLNPLPAAFVAPQGTRPASAGHDPRALHSPFVKELADGR